VLKCSDILSIRAIFGYIEDRFGIRNLSESEKCVFLEDHDQKTNTSQVVTKDILSHVLTKEMSRPTLFRAIKVLIKNGFLEHFKEKNRQIRCYNPRTNHRRYS
jgi:hypothetical protein